MNTFGYVHQNPLRYIDPTGEAELPAAPVVGEACLANPACAALVGRGLAVATICMIHPDLCEGAVDALCEDVGNAWGALSDSENSSAGPPAHDTDFIPGKPDTQKPGVPLDFEYEPDNRKLIDEL